MTFDEIMKALENYGNAQTKKILMRHGAKEPFFGVQVADLKTILKKTKKNHELSLALYATGNSDAMYLAGLMADETKITASQLEAWADQAYWFYLSEFSVPWVASETAFGFELGLKWIQSNEDHLASIGWSTLSSYAAVHPDEKLDIETYSRLLDKVASEIHQAKDRVRSTMNSFVIAVGTYIKDLTEKSIQTARKIGKVTVIKEGTACKTPDAMEYIKKSIDMGRIGKKRKMARC